MRLAIREDIPFLVDLMAEFYAEGGYALNRTRAAEAFAAVISDARLGHVWIIEAEGEQVGHVVLTLKFGMEYGGTIACLDDLCHAALAKQGAEYSRVDGGQKFLRKLGHSCADGRSGLQ